jgi:hypothetical protein
VPWQSGNFREAFGVMTDPAVTRKIIYPIKSGGETQHHGMQQGEKISK